MLGSGPAWGAHASGGPAAAEAVQQVGGSMWDSLDEWVEVGGRSDRGYTMNVGQSLEESNVLVCRNINSPRGSEATRGGDVGCDVVGNFVLRLGLGRGLAAKEDWAGSARGVVGCGACGGSFGLEGGYWL